MKLFSVLGALSVAVILSLVVADADGAQKGHKGKGSKTRAHAVKGVVTKVDQGRGGKGLGTITVMLQSHKKGSKVSSKGASTREVKFNISKDMKIVQLSSRTGHTRHTAVKGRTGHTRHTAVKGRTGHTRHTAVKGRTGHTRQTAVKGHTRHTRHTAVKGHTRHTAVNGHTGHTGHTGVKGTKGSNATASLASIRAGSHVVIMTQQRGSHDASRVFVMGSSKKHNKSKASN